MMLVKDRFRWLRASGLFGTAAVALVMLLGACEDDPGSPTPDLVRLLMDPPSAVLDIGQSQQFRVRGEFSNGSIQDLPATFNTTGGNISNAGVYTATIAGDFTVTGTVTTGQSVTASVRVNAIAAPTLQAVLLTPDTVRLQTGGTAQFQAMGRFSDGTTASIPVTFSQTGGAITNTGLYTAGAAAGTFRVIATAGGGLADTSTVIVTTAPPPPPSLSRIVISPTTATLQTGASQQFTASGVMSDGTSSAVAVVFTQTGGSITAGGLYTAGNVPGNFSVTATHASGLSASAAVTITAPPTLVSMTMLPTQITVFVGDQAQFQITGNFSNGTTRDVTAEASFTATGGTITSPGGLFTAGNTPGNFQVRAQIGTVVATSNVQIVPTLVSIAITPPTASLAPLATQQFTVTGTFSDGSSRNITSFTTLSATGGAISSAGVYTAPANPGSYKVIATSGTLADTADVTVIPPTGTLTGITISPTPVTVPVGGTQQFTVTGQYSNGTTQNHTSSAVLNATGGTITAAGVYTAGNVQGPFQVTASFGGFNATAVVNVGPAVLVSLAITPTPVTLLTGAQQQFTVTGTYSNGTTQNHTATATYTPTGGTITAGGLYTAGNTPGAGFQVVATFGGRTATASITINAPTVTGITITPATVTLTSGATQQFTVTANMSNGTTQNLTASATYTPNGGTITAGGLYTAGNTPGTFNLTATVGAFADTAVVTIPQPTLQSISITPATVTLASGATQQFTVTGNMSNGTTQNLTATATYTPNGGTITAGGLYTAGATPGTFNVIATSGGRADTAVVTIPQPTLQSISITPATVTLASGATQQFTVTGNMSNGTTQNLTATATYTPNGGTITAGGLYTAGATAGTFNVIATSGGRADTAVVTIPAATLQSITITPATVTLASGATQQFTVTGSMSNGTTQNLTASATYTPNGGTITAGGLYTAGATPGTFNVIATSGAFADTAVVTIPQPTLQSITITPATATVNSGATQQFTVTGNMSNGTTQNLTATATYTPNGGTITAGGLYTAGATAGTFNVIATSGAFADTAVVTIPAATLQSITITPATATVNSGATQQFTVTGNMSNGTTQNLTATATYTPNGGTITAGGLYTAGATPGTFNVIATSGGRADTAVVTIPQPTLQSITISPAAVSLSSGATQQFTVTGNMSNGTTQNLTATATYTPNGGTITAGGLYTAGGTAGTFNVIATSGARSDTAVVTITAAGPTLTSIAITPATVTMNTGGTQQFTVTGTFSDNSTADLTAQATFSPTGGTMSGAVYTAGGASGSTFRVIATIGARSDTAAITITNPSSGNYTAEILEDWQRYTDHNDLQTRFGRFRWNKSQTTTVPALYGAAGTRAGVTLAQDQTFGQVVKILFPQNTDQLLGPSVNMNYTLPALLDDMWYRWRVKWEPGWTSTAATPAGHANSYKLAFFTFEQGFGNRGEIEFSNGDQYVSGVGIRDAQDVFYRYNEQPLPGSGDLGDAGCPTLNTPGCHWSSGEWYEFVMHYRRTSQYTGYYQMWRRQLTVNGTIVNNAFSHYQGFSIDGSPGVCKSHPVTTPPSGTCPVPRIRAVDLGVNKNKTNEQDMWLYWGPWEVVDGTKFPNPFGMPQS